MGLDRQLIDSIKSNFADKATAELQEIVRLKDFDRWSEEAFAAAESVLDDRAAGRAKEPRVPVKDAPPPSAEERMSELLPVLGLAMGGLIGGLITKFVVEPESQPIDRPVPFGSNIAWLAVESTDTKGVATALGLRSLREAKWKEGVDAAHKTSVFVTPPLGDWTLAVAGAALIQPEGLEAFVKPLLEQLSHRFKDAQYFCSQANIELFAWARAQKGRLIRGLGWRGQQRLTLWNEGPKTRGERDLGFEFTDGQPTEVEQGRAEERTASDEELVMRLAAIWSIDPTSLDDHFQGSALGLVGAAASRQNGSS